MQIPCDFADDANSVLFHPSDSLGYGFLFMKFLLNLWVNMVTPLAKQVHSEFFSTYKMPRGSIPLSL